MKNISLPMNRKVILIAIAVIIFVLGLVAVVFLIKQQQDLREKAAEQVTFELSGTSLVVHYNDFQDAVIDINVHYIDGRSKNFHEQYSSPIGTTTRIFELENTCVTFIQVHGTNTHYNSDCSVVPTPVPTPTTQATLPPTQTVPPTTVASPTGRPTASPTTRASSTPPIVFQPSPTPTTPPIGGQPTPSPTPTKSPSPKPTSSPTTSARPTATPTTPPIGGVPTPTSSATPTGTGNIIGNNNGATTTPFPIPVTGIPAPTFILLTFVGLLFGATFLLK